MANVLFTGYNKIKYSLFWLEEAISRHFGHTTTAKVRIIFNTTKQNGKKLKKNGTVHIIPNH